MTPIAAINARFSALLPGGCCKADALMGVLVPFSFTVHLKGTLFPAHFLFSQGRCVKPLCTRVGSGGKDASVQGIADKNLAEAVKNILGMASRTSSRNVILHTDFLTPLVLNESISALENFANVKTITQGGYPQAERCRLSIGNPELLTTDPDVVAALSISGNFAFENCSHGDFLGSIIGTGIAREKVGDILLQGKEGAQVLVAPELVEFLMSSLNKVGNVPVTCEQIPLLALKYEPPRTISFTAVEASLRLDALASAGFKISRSKLVSLISNGHVRLNWSPVMKNGTILKTGDVVSASEKGRLKIGKINTTRKGKFAVELIRYL